MKQTEARELAHRFGVRMCDEDGNTHGEELYCFGLDDITAIKEALAQPEQEPVGKFAKFTDGIWREVTDGSAGVSLYATPPQRERVLFPTMLRKMWSGSEVQAWLDENVNKEKNT